MSHCGEGYLKIMKGGGKLFFVSKCLIVGKVIRKIMKGGGKLFFVSKCLIVGKVI